MQAIESSQVASLQQALQPRSAPQQWPPFTHVGNVQLPLTHLPVAHLLLLGQSLSRRHCAVCTHLPATGSHENPDWQAVSSGVNEQVP